MQSTSRNNFFEFSSVQSLTHVRLFATPWTAVCQTSLSITKLLEFAQLMSIESLMPFHLLSLCHPLLLLPSVFLSTRIFSNESSSHQMAKVLEFQLQHQVLPMNIQDWFPLGLTGLILQPKRLLIIFPIPQFKSISSLALSFLYSPSLTSIHVY